MGYQLKNTIKVSELSSKLDLKWTGQDHKVCMISPLEQTELGCLTYSNNKKISSENITIICNASDITSENSNAYILSESPRLDFIRALHYLQSEIGFLTWLEETFIHTTAQIGENVVIEKGCYVGENSTIDVNAVIHKGTQIGKNCNIGSGTNIGSDGFGFERDMNNKLHRFIHLGNVIIGDNVEIGALNSIARGTLNNTIIKDGVKTDNLVHIAHNCVIGKNTIITACAEISGGVVIGNSTWIGPNSSILQKISIGDNSFVGIGAVVTKDVASNESVAGNPARRIKR